MMKHRFGIGEDLGDKAQYFVIGGKEAAEEGILMELAVGDPAKIIFNETKLNGIKVLDTTQTEVAQLLIKNGVPEEALVAKMNYIISLKPLEMPHDLWDLRGKSTASGF